MAAAVNAARATVCDNEDRTMTSPAPGDGQDFKARLAAVAAATERELERRLATDGHTPERLVAAMRHGSLGGGKRLRPFLVVESASLFGITDAIAVPVATALECIHCYSLVHDDLPAMDNDLTRRGQPTVWAHYDEWTAILAGDGLLTLAFEILADPALHVPDARKVALVGALARAAGKDGMVGGQCIDLEADKLGRPSVADDAHVRRLQAMKTGALIHFGVAAGGILGGADRDQSADLDRYGRKLGLAFQIADDLLDVTGDAAVMGKAAGKDAEAGKATLVSLHGVAAARRELEATVADAIAALDRFGGPADTLRATARFVAERDH